MLLTLDVGNTNTVAGLFEGRDFVRHWRFSTQAERTEDELGVLLRALFAAHGGHLPVHAAMLASVVPPVTETLVRMVDRYFGVRCRVVGAGLKTGMPILYENPREVGADRIVNAVAGFEDFGDGRHGLVVVDFGTATTFDCVDASGAYVGGAIAPGLQIAADALFSRTSRLPRTEIARPASPVGTSTVTAIQSGVYWGYVGLVDGLARRCKEALGGGAPVPCIATGGLSNLIGRACAEIDEVDPDLTLTGLRIWSEEQP